MINLEMTPGEFVEILNGTSGTIDLQQHELRFYRTAPTRAVYLVVPLSGTLRASEYLIVGTPSLNLQPGVLRLPFALPQDNIDNAFLYVELTRSGERVDATYDPPELDLPDRPLDTGPGTLCRTQDGTVQLNHRNWTECPSPTPGYGNLRQ
jgi:hypothetical protein